MSIPPESIKSYEDDSTSLTYDMGFGTSDAESLSSSKDESVTVPKDYWFGRKYFECIMALNLCRSTRLYESVSIIDSKLEETIRSFPYLRSLRELELRGISDFPPRRIETIADPYHELMTSIGVLLRSGSHNEKVELQVLLREQAAGCMPSHETNNHSSSLPSRDQQDGETSVPSVLGQYSSALQEYGVQHDFAPTYNVRTVGGNPPKFVATVSFGDNSFHGTARNKRQAKHQAAREACNSLGIQI